uniref:Uncharacterized protein n=1 Tax=Aeromonas hydrophila TaxID=644 RepID=Q5VIZ4_AERHY|nr:unknown [Aeromonas hydrophila]
MYSTSRACLASSQSSIALCLPANARLVCSSSVNIIPPWGIGMECYRCRPPAFLID